MQIKKAIKFALMKVHVSSSPSEPLNSYHLQLYHPLNKAPHGLFCLSLFGFLSRLTRANKNFCG